MTAQRWISRFRRALTILLAWVAILATYPIAPARAQKSIDGVRTARPDSTRAGRDHPQDEQHWMKNLADAVMGHETNRLARNHATVLTAFRETVDLPAKCTVRIHCDDRQVSLGTIIDSQGYIATKASELTGTVTCELNDGTCHRAQLLGSDRGSDLALLKIRAHDLPTIRWNEQAPPSVGGWVVTPGLNDLPVAVGIVSVAPHRVRGGVLGIRMSEDDPGPRITLVVPGSGAALAGLFTGDIITHVNDKPMATSDDMVATTSNMLPGETLQLQILRAKETRRVSATLGSVADTLTSRRARFQDQLGSTLSKRRVLFPLVLEHDSVLAPNQCGGVLVDLDGEAIGVNIARASRISSFAIPTRVALPILESLMSQASDAVTSPVAAQLPPAKLTESAIEQ